MAASTEISSKPTLTLQDLDACLKKLVIWKKFALHLPGINQADLEIIEKDKPGDVVGQKLQLYKVWIRVYPNASWEDVIKALEAVGENAIAKQIREKYLGPFVVQAAGIVAKEEIGVVKEEVTAAEDIVTELDTLHQSFVGLVHDIESMVQDKVENGTLTIKSIVHHLEAERAFPIPSLQSVTTTDELFQAIRPHYSFLDCYLIISIALRFLSGAVAEKATKYKEKVQIFMKTTKIRSLMNSLKTLRECSNTIVRIVVENGWGSQKLWLVRNLITALFPVQHPDELPWYDIVPC